MERVVAFVGREGLLLAVIAVSLAVFLVGLGAHPLFDYDEATYGDVAVKLVQGVAPDALTFWRFDATGALVPWFEKPPLGLWLQAGSMAIFGVHEFAVRFPSALFGVGCVLLVFLIARRLAGMGSHRAAGNVAGTVSALVFLTVPFFVRWAREGRLDSAVVFFMLLALWYWLGWDQARWRRFAFWVALGLGFLVKSAVVAFVPLTIVLTLLVWDRPALWRILKSRDTYVGAALFLAIILPWHVYEFLRYREAFTASYFGKHLVGRAAANFFGDPRNLAYGPGFYLAFLWEFARPWVWVAIAGFAAFGLRAWRERLVQSRLLRVGLMGAVLVLATFTAVPSKLGTYLIPIVPFLAFLVGAYAVSLWEMLGAHLWLRLALAAGFLGLVGMGFATLGETVGATPGFVADERAVGYALRGSSRHAILYRWEFVETIMFYSQKGIRQVGSLDDLGDLTAVSLIVPADVGRTLSLAESSLQLKKLHEGQYLTLVEFVAPR